MGDAGPAERPREFVLGVVRKRRIWIVATAATVLALAGAGAWLLRSGGGPGGRVESVAVLPILDISGADQLFVEALYDQLIGSVGRLEGLSVVSRSAVLPFAKGANVREVAAALKVDAVLEGSVFRAGEVMRINVQLTEPESLRHLWSQSYEQNVSDVLAAQDAVVTKITSDLGAGLARQSAGGPGTTGKNGASR
jgi:TolB-like protein